MGINNKLTVSITLYGKINKSSEDWRKWYNTSKIICKTLGHIANYFSITGENITNSKVKTIKRSENKLLEMLEGETNLRSLSLFVLPDKFTSVISDFTITLSRGEGYVTMIMHKNKFLEIEPQEYVNLLKEHISMDYGEIYEMDINECPEMYASKANDSSFYKTLNILQKF